ncbi:iron-siderophore ABC transporter substrate-binding protein [Devosia sp. 2618]|uniref:iron-siderophore ABC transporter substrate-binding protein n=1 Tax=Devosia sp. 2618 TaxID=3156454 RepID=UPI0033956015
MLSRRLALTLSAALLLSTNAAFAQAITVPTMFGDIAIPDQPARVAALGWSDGEIVLALGVQPVAVANWMGLVEKGVGAWAVDLFGDETPVVLEAGETNFEQLLSATPDLIVNIRSDNSEEAFKRLSAIAPTVYGPEGTAPYAASWTVQVAQIAAAMGIPEKGEALIAATEKSIADSAAAHPEFAGKTIAVVAKYSDTYGLYLPGDARFDLMTQLGFVPTQPVIDAAGNNFFVEIGSENFGLLDADVVVLLILDGTVESLKADPILAKLPAVIAGRTVYPEEDVMAAYSAGSTLALEYSIDHLVPLLAEAAAK